MVKVLRMLLAVVLVTSSIVRRTVRRQHAKLELLNVERRKARLTEIKSWLEAERSRGLA